MYHLSEKEIDFILEDIRQKGIVTESLQQNLLDHICCLLEQDMQPGYDFEQAYTNTLRKFYTKQLSEIEEETIYLLTFKNYYFMKKVLIFSGLAAAGAFVMGSFFKLMHWPGAFALFMLAISITGFLFLPLFFVLKNRELKTVQEKMVLASGVVVAALYILAQFNTLMHWQLGPSGMLWLITIGFSFFVFIPLYFFNGIRKPDGKTNTFLISCFVVIFMSLQFLMVNLRPGQTPQQMEQHAMKK